MIINKKIDLGQGKIISIETGKLAKQADGAVVVRQGDTMGVAIHQLHTQLAFQGLDLTRQGRLSQVQLLRSL